MLVQNNSSAMASYGKVTFKTVMGTEVGEGEGEK
jgi:hypothetical protein